MNFYSIGPRNLRLFPRDEGKIKSYESCCDIRAWSHDCQTRNRYLREWIKNEMPISIIPGCTLACLMRTMTCKSRRRATPHCHPDCKSKVILESICNSCHVMKTCLKNEEYFDKYFDDEELETSHWPCERCLEALKSIKMFWKIIVEKIFRIKLPKEEEPDQNDCVCTDSLRSVARGWQNEMVEQAMFVKSLTPFLGKTNAVRRSGRPKCISNNDDCCNLEFFTDNDKKSDVIRAKSNNLSMKTFKMQSTNTDCLRNKSNTSQYKQKLSRKTSARINTVDVGCNCYSYEDLTKDINNYKTNLGLLQAKLCEQRIELEKIKQENGSLKLELQSLYKNSSWKSIFCSPKILNTNGVSVIPKPFDVDEVCSQCSVKAIESEMIITMKNCKNESYRHISLLQVLHKSNAPAQNELDLEACCSGSRKENPIQLLTKVQNTFGAIVRREMCIASERKREQKFDIDASYYNGNTAKSSSTIASKSCNSRLDFLCTPDSRESPSTQCCLNC